MALKQPAQTGPAEGEPTHDVETTPEELLSLLDAQHTQAILEAIQREAKPARTLAEECGASRPTIYRRLNTLEDAGLVVSRMKFDEDGHHRTVYESTLESATFTVTGDGFSLVVTTDEPGGPADRSTRDKSDLDH
jgi:predicted transcriptional regulator